MGDMGVRDKHLLGLLTLFKPIVGAFALQPPGKEVQVGFVILADVFPGSVVFLETDFKILVQGQSGGLEHLDQEQIHPLVQEDLIVPDQAHPPQPGPQLGPVKRGLVGLVELLEAGQDAVIGHVRTVGDLILDGQAGRVAYDLIQIQIRRGGLEQDVEAVGSVQRFLAGKMDHLKGVFGQALADEVECVIGFAGHGFLIPV